MFRKVFILFLSLIVFLSSSVFNVVADEPSANYLRVIDETTPFYADENLTNLLFYLPYTYYVKVISIDENVARIEYGGGKDGFSIDGYCPTDLLYADNLAVANPYLDLTITTATHATIYDDKGLSEGGRYVFKDRELKYYGKVEVGGKNVYCVGYLGKLSYVAEEYVTPFSVAFHPNELTFKETITPDNGTEGDGSQKNDNLNGLRISIFVCLMSAGLIALLIALKRKPKRTIKTDYYDENDYE